MKSSFSKRARIFIVNYLKVIGECSSEQIVNAARDAGIKPRDDRAFGPIFMSLSKRNEIERTGHCLRTKGHNAPGGTLWKIKG